MLTIEHAMSLSDLDRISWVLNNKLRGSTLSDMRGRLLKEIQAEVSAYTSFLENMFRAAHWGDA